jgi:hypothetical protein
MIPMKPTNRVDPPTVIVSLGVRDQDRLATFENQSRGLIALALGHREAVFGHLRKDGEAPSVEVDWVVAPVAQVEDAWHKWSAHCLVSQRVLRSCQQKRGVECFGSCIHGESACLTRSACNKECHPHTEQERRENTALHRRGSCLVARPAGRINHQLLWVLATSGVAQSLTSTSS